MHARVANHCVPPGCAEEPPTLTAPPRHPAEPPTLTAPPRQPAEFWQTSDKLHGAEGVYCENSFLKATVCVGVLSTTYYVLRLVRLLVHFLTKLKHNWNKFEQYIVFRFVQSISCMVAPTTTFNMLHTDHSRVVVEPCIYRHLFYLGASFVVGSGFRHLFSELTPSPPSTPTPTPKQPPFLMNLCMDISSGPMYFGLKICAFTSGRWHKITQIWERARLGRGCPSVPTQICFCKVSNNRSLI
jgi:hypothetical protein